MAELYRKDGEWRLNAVGVGYQGGLQSLLDHTSRRRFMGINLQKGQRISLSKEAPGLTNLMCGLGWDVAKRSGGGLFAAFSNK